MAKRRKQTTPDGTTEDLPRSDERTVEEIEQREEEAAAAAEDENPDEREPEELDRELGISRGPETPVQSSAEVLDARDRRRK
jgi:hypothetical protein